MLFLRSCGRSEKAYIPSDHNGVIVACVFASDWLRIDPDPIVGKSNRYHNASCPNGRLNICPL